MSTIYVYNASTGTLAAEDTDSSPTYPELLVISFGED